MKKGIALLLTLLLITVCFAACGGEKNPADAAAEGGKLNVVCSIFPQYDFVKAIAGDKVNLTTGRKT